MIAPLPLILWESNTRKPQMYISAAMQALCSKINELITTVNTLEEKKKQETSPIDKELELYKHFFNAIEDVLINTESEKAAVALIINKLNRYKQHLNLLNNEGLNK